MPPTQHLLDVFRAYGTLAGERESWAGALILCCGEGAAASGLSVAVSLAGGASLTIDADAGALKSAMRSGELDFVVNTLDEAIRTLKNEVRQHRPLSVGLIADVPQALAEAVERGLQPDMLLVGPDQSAQSGLQDKNLTLLRDSGMPLRLLLRPDGERQPPEPAPEVILYGRRFREHYISVATPTDLREIDVGLLAIIPESDLIRRRWIQDAPKYLREARSGGRLVWLNDDETQRWNGLAAGSA